VTRAAAAGVAGARGTDVSRAARIPEAVAGELRAVVGADAVLTDPDRLLGYESDGLVAYRHAPDAVVLPRTTEEASEVLRVLHGAGLPVVPRGAGTGLSGGAVALGGGVVVGTARMDRILSLEPAERLARVQAGVVNVDLSVAARPHGLHYAPDPSSQSACTLGGNVAENSGGPHCLKYGVTTRYVTGLTLVLADGSVARLGGATGEAGGYDLVGAVVGSEGCFGLVTEIELRLVPIPGETRTLLAIFDRIEDAGRAVTRIIGSGLLPAALEIIDGETIRAVEASVFAAGYPVDAGAALVVEFDGAGPGLDGEAARAEACCLEEGADAVRRARSEEERAALWKGRKKAFGAMGRVAPDLMVQDATVPRSRLPEVLGAVRRIAERYELTVANVFHAGDGNLHPNILFDRRNEAEVARVERASKEIMRACVDAGGTITGEHGVGIDKREYMALVYGVEELRAMRDVRRAFDPDGRFNPGKVLPEIDPGSGDSEADPARDDEGAPDGGPPAGAAGKGRPPEVAASDEVVEYEPADLTITVGAGLSLERLDAVTREHGQWLPIDGALDGRFGAWPGAPDDVATLLATAPAQLFAARYGGVRDLVLGLTLVTGDGRALRLGGRVVKNVAGFDLVRLVVGSGGDLGVIAEASLRLYPRPEEERRLVMEASDADGIRGLGRAARAVAAASVVPAAVAVTGEGGSARLEVVLHGTSEAVEAEAQALREAVGGLRPLPEPDGSRRGTAPGSGPVVRLHLPPSRFDDLVAWAADGAGVAEVERFVADAAHGWARLELDTSVADADLDELRRRVEAGGGAVAIEGGGSSASASDPHGRVVCERIRRAFDPEGTLGRDAREEAP